MELTRAEIINRITYLLSTRASDEQMHILHLLEGNTGLPISAFTAPLSTFEILVKYLLEEEKRSATEISSLLNRQQSTIYATYRAAQKKFPNRLDVSDTSLCIPFDIFSDRSFSSLEHLIAYLFSEKHLSLHEIAQKVHRSYSTVKSIHWKYKQKKNQLSTVSTKNTQLRISKERGRTLTKK